MSAGHMRMIGRAGRRQDPAERVCSIELALRVVGARGALLLLREAHYGVTRFDEFVARTGLTEEVAATRLRELVAAGLLERRAYRDPGQRTRQEYVLTPSGADLLPVLLGLLQWGDRHADRRGEPPLSLQHSGCGAAVTVRVGCAAGHEVALPDIDVHAPR
jgi:DNA-binding HxlR family transcriptional regulator